MAMRRARLAVPFLLAIYPAAPQTPTPAALPARETLYYNVEWRLITAGKARVSWQATQGGWQLDLRLDSVGLISRFFQVSDQYQSSLNQSLCVTNAQMSAREGSRDRDTRVTFDGAARKAHYLERDRAKNAVIAATDIEIPACVHDVPGGLFFLRTLNLEPGQGLMVPVSDGKKSVMARVEAQVREDVKTPLGVFHTMRYEAFLFNNVLYRRPAHLAVWLTDDKKRLPVQIQVRMQFTIGTVTLQLEKHE